MPTIHVTSHLRRVAPSGPTRVEAATLGAALDAYFETAPQVRAYILDDQGRLRKHVAVFIDGELLTDKRDLGRSVAPNSEIYVMQALSGGREEMTQDLFVSTRKGLFRFQRSGGKWQQTYVAFLGQPVTAFLADPRTGNWYAALNLGHFGAKLHRSTNQGATWDELAMPTLPKSEDKDAPSLNQIWALEAGGADQPGLIWAGSLPAALFRNDRNGEGAWQLVEGLWNLPDRAKWFGGGTDDTALHSLCIDPRNSSRLVIAISCGGVWRSEDAGASWTCRSKGLFAEYMPPDRREDPAIQDPHRIVQCRDKPDHFWCQHHNGIFFSTNDLESWQFAGPRFGFGVAVHPKEPAKAWFVPAIKDELRVPQDGHFVASRTRDGGQSFEALSNGLPTGFGYDLVLRHALDIDPTGDTLAFGSTTGNLYVTEDQGEHWHAVTHHLPPVHAVRFGAG